VKKPSFEHCFAAFGAAVAILAVFGFLKLTYEAGYQSGHVIGHKEGTSEGYEIGRQMEPVEVSGTEPDVATDIGALIMDEAPFLIEIDDTPPHFVVGPEFWNGVSKEITEVEFEVDGYIIRVVRPVREGEK